MKSIFNHYLECKRSYYGIHCEVENLFTNAQKTSKEACRSFLNEHYKRGKKEG